MTCQPGDRAIEDVNAVDRIVLGTAEEILACGIITTGKKRTSQLDLFPEPCSGRIDLQMKAKAGAHD